MYYYSNNLDSLSRRWTNEAKMCYERGCRCEGCLNKLFFDKYGKEHRPKATCQMKRYVIELVRKFGKPEGKGGIYGKTK